MVIRTSFLCWGDCLCNRYHSIFAITKKQTGKNTFPYLANYNVQWVRFDLEELHQMDFEPAEQKEFELKDIANTITDGIEDITKKSKEVKKDGNSNKQDSK